MKKGNDCSFPFFIVFNKKRLSLYCFAFANKVINHHCTD